MKFAAIVGTEKEKGEKENDKANIEAAKCQQIKEDVLAKKESTENDLAAAIPLVEEAKRALQGI
jgi:dynein heavy chain